MEGGKKGRQEMNKKRKIIIGRKGKKEGKKGRIYGRKEGRKEGRMKRIKK